MSQPSAEAGAICTWSGDVVQAATVTLAPSRRLAALRKAVKPPTVMNLPELSVTSRRVPLSAAPSTAPLACCLLGAMNV